MKYLAVAHYDMPDDTLPSLLMNVHLLNTYPSAIHRCLRRLCVRRYPIPGALAGLELVLQGLNRASKGSRCRASWCRSWRHLLLLSSPPVWVWLQPTRIRRLPASIRAERGQPRSLTISCRVADAFADDDTTRRHSGEEEQAAHRNGSANRPAGNEQCTRMMPRRVGVCQRVVQRVRVAVQVLRIDRAAAGAALPIT